MMLMRWDVSLDLKTSKDGAHVMFLGIALHSFGPPTAFNNNIHFLKTR